MLVRMYLRGDFGTHPEDVNPYAASTFYAADRYASYKTDWQKDWEQGKVIFCDRYTTSNAVHQSSKLPEEQLEPFTEWLFDYEYNLLGLPAPDLVFYLDMPTEVTEKLMRRREAAEGSTADIHEQDLTYLATCREMGRTAAEYYGWTVIDCVREGAMRSIEDIHQEILGHVKACLEG